MQALCFDSIEKVTMREIADPAIEETRDAIVRVQLAGLCGSDLHPFFGRELGIDRGTVMGHEFVGEVVAMGDDVRDLKVGDRVCAPFTTNCGDCFYCLQGLTSRCVHGQLFGWRSEGGGLHGGQAQYIRVPFADATLMAVPDGLSNEAALLLGDNLSTGYFAAEMAGVSEQGVYGVIGCGTVGLLTVAAAKRLGASSVVAIDPNPSRAAMAERLGAIAFTSEEEASDAVSERTQGRGADAVMELVGLPAAQKFAYRLVRPGGTMSVIGCHCTPHFAFAPSDAYDKNLTYRTGRCPARHYMSRLAGDLARNPMDLSWCVSHTFSLDDAVEAYDTFAYGKHDCVKAALRC